MRIAIIIERADIALGGAERSVFELASALETLGLDVHILAAKGTTSEKNIHILCQNTRGSRTNCYTFAKALKKHLEDNHYDIIHSVVPFDFADVYQPRGGSYAESILRNAAGCQSKFIAAYKKITAFANWRRTLLIVAEKRLCKNPAGPLLAALSQYVASQFRQHYRLDDGRIVVIPNGVKTNKEIDTAKAHKLRSQILAALRITEADKPVFFLFVANNFRLKGLTPLIEAMNLARSAKTQYPAYLIVAGNDSTRKYRILAGQLNLEERIIFLGPLRQIQNALSVIDVAILPTFYDPSSRFILEALAAGRPVITTPFNGATDLFTHNRHGKVIDRPDNVPALAQAISYFCDRDNIRKASEAIIEDNLREKISINRAARQLNSLYRQILEKRRPK